MVHAGSAGRRLTALGAAAVICLGASACSQSARRATPFDELMREAAAAPAESPDEVDLPLPGEHKRLLLTGERQWKSPFRSGQPARGKVIYLTFDDGPLPPYTDQVLNLLDTYRAKATFFMVGSMAAEHPETVREVASRGHAIGNHTEDHADLAKLDAAGVREQLEHGARDIGRAMGPCMRPPYGSLGPKVRAVAKSLGYSVIGWSAEVADWDSPTPDRMVAGMRRATTPGMVMLLHDGGGDRTSTVAALARILPYWYAKGYTFDSLPECLR